MEEKLITHYTSDIGFENIINNSKLWFTDIRYLNDYQERKLYISKTKERLNERDEYLADEESAEFLSCLTNSYGAALAKRRFFVFSCSTNPDSLPLWNYYSKGSLVGGYNLSFNLHELLLSVFNQTKDLKEYFCVLAGAVQYDDSILKAHLTFAENLSIHLLSLCTPQQMATMLTNYMVAINLCQESQRNTFLAEAEAEFSNSNFLNKIEKYKNFNCTNGDIFVERFTEKGLEKDFINMEAFFKQQCFSPEAEFRIVIEVKDENIDFLAKAGLYKVRLSRGRFVPYLEIPFDLTAVKEIKIAPTNYYSNCIDNVKEFINIKGIYPEVTKSVISVDF